MVDENLKEFLENYLSGQTSQKPNGRTYTFRYGRTVNLGNFESVRLELEETFDSSIPKETAVEAIFRSCSSFSL
jgi:hypothetical protein